MSDVTYSVSLRRRASGVGWEYAVFRHGPGSALHRLTASQDELWRSDWVWVLRGRKAAKRCAERVVRRDKRRQARLNAVERIEVT